MDLSHNTSLSLEYCLFKEKQIKRHRTKLKTKHTKGKKHLIGKKKYIIFNIFAKGNQQALV